ncbi:hypothetical protein YC2023_046892 [Brassica napus]
MMVPALHEVLQWFLLSCLEFEELCEFGAEIKLSLFQLGFSPQNNSIHNYAGALSRSSILCEDAKGRLRWSRVDQELHKIVEPVLRDIKALRMQVLT